MKIKNLAAAVVLCAAVPSYAAEVMTRADLEGNQARFDALYEYANLSIKGSKLQGDKDNALLTAYLISQGISQSLPSMITNPDEALATCEKLAADNLFIDGNASDQARAALFKFLRADCLRNVGQKRLIK